MSELQPFELLSETVVHENPFFSILDRHYRMPDGSEHHYYVRKEVDTCCVLPMTSDGLFVLQKEYRVGPGKVLHQLPAGRLEGFDDDPDERIRKELLEETGYSGTFKKIGAMPTSPYSTRVIHCYYATDCQHISDQQLDHTEFIDVVLANNHELESILMAGQSSSCAPGLWAWEWLKKDGHIK